MRSIFARLGEYLISAFVVATLATATANAQAIKGAISGTVVDQSGAAVPGADVVATNNETRQEFRTSTEPAGLFRLSLLPVGTYRVEISKAGFNKLGLSDVQVDAGEDHGLRTLQLEVGQLTTAVEVVAAPPLLDTTSAQVTDSIKGDVMQHMPGVLANQGLDNLALLVPGVIDVRDNQFSNTNGVGFSANGLRGRTNDQQIDGQNNNDNSVAGPYLFFTNVDFVQEYQITTSNFGPEYGRNSGSVVNVVTKSGTNNWHGTVFGVESNSALDSLTNLQKTFEGLKKVPRHNDEFTGGSIGGPIRKHKVFVFGGFDNEIRSESQVYSTGNLTPTPAGLTQLSACPFTDPSILNVLQKYGPFGVSGGNPSITGTPGMVTITDPNDETVTCDVEMSGVQRTLPAGFHQYDVMARLDVNATDHDRIYGRYLYQKLPFFNTDAFGTAAAGYPANVPGWSEDIGLSWTRTLSGRMVNEVRGSYGRLFAGFGGNSIGNTIPSFTAIDTGLANFNLPSGYLDFGPSTGAPQGRTVNTYQVQDNLNYVRGRHQFKAGVNYTYQRSPNNFLPNVNGRYNFDTFDQFIANMPGSINIAVGDPNLDFREHQMFVYAGDDWKVTPNLTLNLGLTYSYFGQPANLFHTKDLKHEANDSTAFWDPTLPLSLRVFPEIPSVKTSFGPSVGFAYTPRWGGMLTGEGKTVLRGGYRLAYDPPFYNIYLNISSAAPQVLSQTLTGSDALSNPAPADPHGPNVRSALASYLVFGVADPRRFNQTTITPNFGPDQVQSWSFGLQRELVSNAVLEVRYVGNHGGKLFQSINANPRIRELYRDFPSSLPSNVTPCTDSTQPGYRRADCGLGVVRKRTNTGYSDYHGLQTQLRATNLARQLSMILNYTWSKTTDNASEIFGTGGGGTTSAFAQDPLSFKGAEHGLSGLDIPHNFSVGFYEEIPAYRDQRGLAGKILGGWAVSGAYMIASGQVYTPVQYCLNYCSEGVQYADVTFNTGFAGQYEVFRPFVSNPKAPVGNVGIFAGDLCNYDGAAGCNRSPDQLVSFNYYNSLGADIPVPASSVRYVVNAPEADRQFGTPWGTAAQNSARDYHTNRADFSIFKNFRLTESKRLQWWVQFANVFNHPNFASIDPYIDDAGYAGEYTGFGDVRLQDGGKRTIRFGLKFFF